MAPDLPFDRSTFERRWSTLRDHLDRAAIDCALVLGPEAQYWLCGYNSFLGAVLPQALVFPAKQLAPAILVWDADVAIARQTSLVDDIRTYRFGVDEPSSLMAAVAAEKTTGLRRIGVDFGSPIVSYAFGTELVAKLEGVEVVDLTLDLAKMRSIKEPEELALMRVAGDYARKGLVAARAHARPGVSETALAAEVEYAMRSAGSDYCSIPTEITSGRRSVQVHGTPTLRRLEAGDLVHIEIGGVEQRYNCVAIQTIVVPGGPPKARALELYDLALRCFRSGLHQLKPDVRAADIEAPALDLLRKSGAGDNFKMRFGYGVGIGYPPSWLEPLKITRTSTDVLVPGITFVLHACLLDDAEDIGVLVGGTYAITDDGYELLSGAGDVELS